MKEPRRVVAADDEALVTGGLIIMLSFNGDLCDEIVFLVCVTSLRRIIVHRSGCCRPLGSFAVRFWRENWGVTCDVTPSISALLRVEKAVENYSRILFRHSLDFHFVLHVPESESDSIVLLCPNTQSIEVALSGRHRRERIRRAKENEIRLDKTEKIQHGCHTTNNNNDAPLLALLTEMPQYQWRQKFTVRICADDRRRSDGASIRTVSTRWNITTVTRHIATIIVDRTTF